MCGIVGMFSKGRLDQPGLAAAVEALAPRGPDGRGMYVDPTGRVGLGHTRLAIIDLSPQGAQPMRSHDGRYVISYNGEIYNFPELRNELAGRGVRFRGHSDTEVLLEGFAMFGPAVLDRLNGIFALAIHDEASGEVFLARDQMGVKPLYYSATDTGVVFASELKALHLLMKGGREIDVSAVAKYLTFLWCPGEQTLFKTVKKLEPGSAMVIRDGVIVRRWTYWRQPHYEPRRDWTIDQCARELRAKVDAVVDRQMVSDAPVGAFLSGGLDSSAIVSAARRTGHDLQCFTINTGEVEDGATDDLPYARVAAADLRVQLHEVRVDGHTMARAVTDMVRLLDEPLADPACLNVLFISRLARSHGMKVMLSGAGGDDLFTGYRRHSLLKFDPLVAAIPPGLRRRAAAWSERIGQSSGAGRRLAKALSLAAADGDRRIEAAFAWGPTGVARSLLRPDLADEGSDDSIYGPFDAVLADGGGLPAIEKCLLLEKRFFLADHNLTYTDKMGMAAGVEVRVPLLDLDLVNFAATIPAEWKHRGLTAKWIFKRSQMGVLPERVINRPKTGFGAPLRLWLNRELRDLADDLLSPDTIERRGLFDPAAVTRLRRADAAGECDGTYSLFSLMCLELWCREFLDAPSKLAAA